MHELPLCLLMLFVVALDAVFVFCQPKYNQTPTQYCCVYRICNDRLAEQDCLLHPHRLPACARLPGTGLFHFRPGPFKMQGLPTAITQLQIKLCCCWDATCQIDLALIPCSIIITRAEPHGACEPQQPCAAHWSHMFADCCDAACRTNVSIHVGSWEAGAHKFTLGEPRQTNMHSAKPQMVCIPILTDELVDAKRRWRGGLE